METIIQWLQIAEVQAGCGLLLLFIVAWLASIVVKRVLSKLVHYLSMRAWQWGEIFIERKTVLWLSRMAPSLIIQFGLGLVPNLPPAFEKIILNVALAATILFLILVITSLLDALEMIYQRVQGQTYSIKSYIQLLKIGALICGVIVIVSTLIDRSPLILLSGLGAMSAVLMLVFKDTLLSLVASIQLTTNDMLRVGDWIEMPQVGADGNVTEIALHTVKVQNWDKTITLIPTWRLIAESYRNWRGMEQAGGRRIKRTLRINAASVRFLQEGDIAVLMQINLIADYLVQKQEQLECSNRLLAESAPANRRRLTNIGTFRAYVRAYLDNHPNVHHNMACMVRMLEPTADGIPMEIYCFTPMISAVDYECIQSDIFDHLLAILPEFDLSLFQYPAGSDIRAALTPLRVITALQ